MQSLHGTQRELLGSAFLLIEYTKMGEWGYVDYAVNSQSITEKTFCLEHRQNVCPSDGFYRCFAGINF